MPDCHACTAAELSPRAGLYHADCHRCTARAVANSLAAFRAARGDDADRLGLSDRVAALMPGVPLDEAMAMVRGWWRRMRGAAQ